MVVRSLGGCRVRRGMKRRDIDLQASLYEMRTGNVCPVDRGKGEGGRRCGVQQ